MKAKGKIDLEKVPDFYPIEGLTKIDGNLDADIETVFLTPSEKNSFISSTLIKEVSKHGGDISSFVDKDVAKRLQDKQWL